MRGTGPRPCGGLEETQEAAFWPGPVRAGVRLFCGVEHETCKTLADGVKPRDGSCDDRA
jgi:hypothetical protein